MTEKEFRKLVTDLEVSKTFKDSVTQDINTLTTLISEKLTSFLEMVSLEKVGAFAKNTMIATANLVDLMIVINLKSHKTFKLMNQLVVNELINIIAYHFDNITKISDIEYNSSSNSIMFNIIKGDQIINYNLLIRYNNVLEDISFNDSKLIKKHTEFVELANRDYTYFKNTIAIIKNYRDEQKINISGHILEVLLYYSLNEYFRDNRYETYLNAFLRGIDDFLKQKVIEVSDDIYQKLAIAKPSFVQTKGYTILDVNEKSINLTPDMNELKLSEYRKLKKAISKLVDVNNTDLSKEKVILDINPKIIDNMYVWSYHIENSKYANDGGSYPMTEANKMTAMLKALSKGLKTIVENNLNKKQVKIISSVGNILKKDDLLSAENNSRKKTILAYVEVNNITFD